MHDNYSIISLIEIHGSFARVPLKKRVSFIIASLFSATMILLVSDYVNRGGEDRGKTGPLILTNARGYGIFVMKSQTQLQVYQLPALFGRDGVKIVRKQEERAL